MKKIASIGLSFLIGNIALAQDIRFSFQDWEYEMRTGIQIGGMSPLPLPREIRQIESYTPMFLPSIEGRMTKWMDQKQQWGILTGLRLESKGMRTHAQVKNYSMEITGNDGSHLQGYWTGKVYTNVRNTYLTFPVSAIYKLNTFLQIYGGIHFSYVLSGKFYGNVYEGYLRKDNPTGDKVNFNNGATATYNFSENLRRFQWGVQAGIDWQVFNKLKAYGELSWGLNDIFHADFQTISFSMYPIFLNIGIGYVF